MDRFDYGSFAGDASQRVHAIVSSAEAEAAGLVRDAEREAELIRRDAQAEGDRIIDDARRRADDLVAERMQRLVDLSDGVVERTEMLFDRMDAAGHVRRQLDGLLRALGETAEQVSRESTSRRPAPRTASRHTPPPARPAPPPGSRYEPQPARVEATPSTPPPQRPQATPSTPPPTPRREPNGGATASRPAPAPRSQAEQPADEKNDARFDGARLVALQMAVAGSTREEVHAELQRAFRLSDPSSILDDVFGSPRSAGALN